MRGIINVVVTVRALNSEMHSGMFGGAAPDAMAALVEMLATLRDEKGNTIGTGTREVCEVLIYIITKPTSQSISGRINTPGAQRPNVRAAIAI